MDAAQTIGQQNAAQQIYNGKRLPVYDIDNTDDQIGKADQPERFTENRSNDPSSALRRK